MIRGLSCPIDISKIFFPSNETHEYLFNSLHWGMASNVNMMAEQLRWMGKAVRYTTASLLEVFKGEKTLAIIQMEDKGMPTPFPPTCTNQHQTESEQQ